jgi:glycine/D-amino acid oxidase-like deaminating enzyme
VRLGLWSRRFYLSQREELGTDSGFTEQGYLLPCFTEADVAAARERMTMQSALGVPVRWLDPDEVDALNPTLVGELNDRRLLGHAWDGREIEMVAVSRATGSRISHPVCSVGCGAVDRTPQVHVNDR